VPAFVLRALTRTREDAADDDDHDDNDDNDMRVDLSATPPTLSLVLKGERVTLTLAFDALDPTTQHVWSVDADADADEDAGADKATPHATSTSTDPVHVLLERLSTGSGASGYRMSPVRFGAGQGTPAPL
jgi:hypothetical protein